MNKHRGSSLNRCLLILAVGIYLPLSAHATQAACAIPQDKAIAANPSSSSAIEQSRSSSVDASRRSNNLPGGLIIGSVLGIATAIDRLGSHSLDMLSLGINGINRLASNPGANESPQTLPDMELENNCSPGIEMPVNNFDRIATQDSQQLVDDYRALLTAYQQLGLNNPRLLESLMTSLMQNQEQRDYTDRRESLNNRNTQQRVQCPLPRNSISM